MQVSFVLLLLFIALSLLLLQHCIGSLQVIIQVFDLQTLLVVDVLGLFQSQRIALHSFVRPFEVFQQSVQFALLCQDLVVLEGFQQCIEVVEEGRQQREVISCFALVQARPERRAQAFQESVDFRLDPRFCRFD